MAVTLNASTSSGLVQSADTSGIIQLQSNGSTKLTLGSSGASIDQYNPSASLITSGTAVASTSGTSIDFTGIPSWAKRVTVMLSAVRQNTGGANPFVIRLGTSGGIVATGYVGAQGYVGGGPAATSMNTGFEIYFDTAVNFYGGILTLTNVSSNTWVGSGVFGQNQGYTLQIGGSVDLGATLTQVRVTTINGTHTFVNGLINILYE